MHARALASLVLAVALAPAIPARAITNGTLDGGDPEVAAILDGDDATLCTGTLVAPEAVLTAAHCFDDTLPAHVYFGATPPASGILVGIAAFERHPNYDAATHAHDIAIVRLDARPPIATARMYGMPLDASFSGAAIRLVGFGRTSTSDDSAPQKRTGQSRVSATGDGSFSFRPSPSQTCFGDSGGPAFAVVGGVEQLVGVTSTGDLGCSGGATDVVVQAFDSGFVAGYLAGSAGPPEVVGGCALAGAPASASPWLIVIVLALAARRATQGIAARSAHSQRAIDKGSPSSRA